MSTPAAQKRRRRRRTTGSVEVLAGDERPHDDRQREASYGDVPRDEDLLGTGSTHTRAIDRRGEEPSDPTPAAAARLEGSLE